MTSDADRLAALEKQVEEIKRALKALEESIQAIEGTLAKQARAIRYMESQVQDIDGRIRSRSTTRRERKWNTRLKSTARGNPPE